MAVSPHFIALAKRYEGLRLAPYLCQAGVPTIGWGSTVYPSGVRVKMTDPPITTEEADNILQVTAAGFQAEVLRVSPSLALQAEPVIGAVADFAYNLGTARYRASTYRRCVEARNWNEARKQLRLWVIGGGKRLPGLVARRSDEERLLVDYAR